MLNSLLAWNSFSLKYSPSWKNCENFECFVNNLFRMSLFFNNWCKDLRTGIYWKLQFSSGSKICFTGSVTQKFSLKYFPLLRRKKRGHQGPKATLRGFEWHDLSANSLTTASSTTKLFLVKYYSGALEYIELMTCRSSEAVPPSHTFARARASAF